MSIFGQSGILAATITSSMMPDGHRETHFSPSLWLSEGIRDYVEMAYINNGKRRMYSVTLFLRERKYLLTPTSVPGRPEVMWLPEPVIEYVPTEVKRLIGTAFIPRLGLETEVIDWRAEVITEFHKDT